MQAFLGRVTGALGARVARWGAQPTRAEWVDLAAHAWACCAVLEDAALCPEIRRVVPPAAIGDLTGWLDRADPTDPPGLYRALTRLLVDVDRACAQALARDGGLGLPARVQLDRIDLEDGPGLHGVVEVWLRPASALRSLARRRGGATDYTVGVDRLLRHLGFAWDRGGRPRIVPVHGDPGALGLDPVHDGFRVGLVPMAGVWAPRFEVAADGRSFLAAAEQDVDAASHGALQALRLAEDARVDLLALPELMVPAAAAADIGQALGGAWPAAVVAGSFHVPHEGAPVNAAPVLDESGALLWEHHKRGLFRVRRRDVVRSPLFVGGLPDEGPDEIVEGIHAGRDLHVIDVPVGRLAVVICADVLDLAQGYRAAIETAHPDLLVVVSMTPELRPFLGYAEDLLKLQVGTMLVNAAPVARGQLLAFVALPVKPGKLPVRLGWRLGDDALEVYQRLWDAPVERWKPDGRAVGWLGAREGLVVDLAAWWNEDLGLGEAEVRA